MIATVAFEETMVKGVTLQKVLVINVIMVFMLMIDQMFGQLMNVCLAAVVHVMLGPDES